MANWEVFGAEMIGRVHRKAVGRLLDERAQALLRELLAYRDVGPPGAARTLRAARRWCPWGWFAGAP
ncbi:hypothetical protein [Mangrovibrevibacter kandeliae]|uniref:hypothetical protein n=1 Tax=Mangrovibrevibacter kandeliae TaxID=2968473 RepID=UPI00389A2B7F